MPSKKERLDTLARVWNTPTPFDIDFFDKGNEVVIVSSYRDIVTWWMNIFKVMYPNDTFREKADIIKINVGPKVVLKLNKRTGTMKVCGKEHLLWLTEEFPNVLDVSNDEMESLADASDTSVTRYLQLDKNVEEVQDLIDMIPDGGGIMMNDFIMKLWKNLLDDWMGCGATIYVVTPRIDEERLFQLFLLMIRNKGTGFHISLVTPAKSSQDNVKFIKVLDTAKRMMKKTRTPREQKRLVSDVKMHWAMSNLHMHHMDFSTNFIAGFKDDEAELLSTTAHFHKSHFHSNQRDNVIYNRITTDELRRNYLFPLGLTPVNY